jgi:hypothetical protein
VTNARLLAAVFGIIAMVLFGACSAEQERRDKVTQFRDKAIATCGAVSRYLSYYEQTYGAVGLQAGLDVLHEIEKLGVSPSGMSESAEKAVVKFKDRVGGRLLEYAKVQALAQDCYAMADALDAELRAMSSPSP